MGRAVTDQASFRALVNIPLNFIFIVPLSVKRDLSSLAFVSLLTVVALLYCCVLLFAELPAYNHKFRNLEGIEVTPLLLDANFLQACSMTFFAYTVQFAILPIYSELTRPSYPRIKKVITFSLVIDFVVYALIGTAGYFSTFNFTGPIVIYRDPLTAGSQDLYMLVCAAGFVLVMISSIPCTYNPFR